MLEVGMFNVGDYAVCPGHGVGQIVAIEERELGGDNKRFYIVKIIANGLSVMVPVDSETGVRHLVEDQDITEVYELLKTHDIAIDNSTWNRRYREYMTKIKTGSLIEIAEVLRALFLLKSKKTLSFGEKKMLDQCRDLLALEISLSSAKAKEDVKGQINSCFEGPQAQA